MKKIKSSLPLKLIASFLAIAVISAALVSLFVHLTSANRLNTLVVSQQRSYLQTALVDYYSQYGSWAGVEENWPKFTIPIPNSNNAAFPPQTGSNGQPAPNRQAFERFSLFGLADKNGVMVVGLNPNYPIDTLVPTKALKAGLAIEVNGEQVGTILTANLRPQLTPEESLYLNRTNQAILLAGLAAIVIALAGGILLARELSRPIKELTLATSKITKGELGQEVTVRSTDEVGQLAASFNQMSKEVAHVNLLRRQMTADIAHDLRTPLTVISGYIEAMRDQVLDPTPERLAIIYTEIELLQKLVEDLRELSQAEAGELRLNRQQLPPGELLDRAASLFANAAKTKEIDLRTIVNPELPALYVDEARMMQVMENLISNALRYTLSGGKIILRAALENNQICLSVEDTGQGIAPEDLPLVFNRLYRGDPSRAENEGSTGLGLSIAKAFVQAHAGTISVESTLGKGTIIFIHLPIEKHRNNNE